MNKRKWSILSAIFFLVQCLSPCEIFSAANFPLTQIKVDSNSQDQYFKKIYDSICAGLFIYRLDVIERHAKENLIKDFGNAILKSEVKFDLENIDIGKKGWTRYYPFSIGDKNFIMRIFLTGELYYQPKARVLYEGTLSNPAVTFQILPSLNDILSDCKIKPFKTYSTAQVDRSS